MVVFLMRSEHEGQIVCPRLASVEAATLFGRPFAHYGADNVHRLRADN